MKWFLTGVTAASIATSAYALAYHQHLYSWTWAISDVALVAVACLLWFAKKEPA